MSLLNRVVAYWHDCVKNEDTLEADISLNVSNKAVLYPFEKDHFIFNRSASPISISDSRLISFADDCRVKDRESFYGFPVLFYFDDKSGESLLAPLFLIKTVFTKNEQRRLLQTDERVPTCGIQALSKIGLRSEEIADVSQAIERLFNSDLSSSKELAKKCIEIIKKEAEIAIIEEIDPETLTNSSKLSRTSRPGIYNKSLLFQADNSSYNIGLLKDLLQLKGRADLEDTSLSFLTKQKAHVAGAPRVPVLPFPANEYQIVAMQDIFENSLSVITGPPGTGKSQFIANLLVNLFLANKTVLFVSHTNEAVDVVNRKINEHFRNLMLRTGNKEFRQDLKGKFNELIQDSSKVTAADDYRNIAGAWNAILRYRKLFLTVCNLERQFGGTHQQYLNECSPVALSASMLIDKLKAGVRRLLLKLRLSYTKYKLLKLPKKSDIAQEVRKLERRYYDSSKRYIKSIFLQQMLGDGKGIGKIKSFLEQVDARPGEEGISSNFFRNALQVLRIWACTLKSLRRTFPLSPGIFDYVIFDEASQIDLPSAAPALYRAKNAIIVGDPMQLAHVAGITKNRDRDIAETHGLIEHENLYPNSIRYCDVSLYRSAEKSLDHKPLLLTNHYRSEDQIIDLCNRAFYRGNLKIMTDLDYTRYPNSLPVGVKWIDCAGEVIKHPAGSRVNYQEAKIVTKAFHDILNRIKDTNLSIGIVTPYSRQQDAISEKIKMSTDARLMEKHDVKILTAHKFQGSEKDIMIFSLVLTSRGTGNSDNWYNIYPQILNVALSRAKYLLCIVGDRSFCHMRSGILKKIAAVYDDIKAAEGAEQSAMFEKIDSPAERVLFQKLMETNFDKYGYKLVPKLVVKRYTLDFALMGKTKIDIECDGSQHQLIEGIPVLEDVERDHFLQREGWEIIRFPNYKILTQPEGIAASLLDKVKACDAGRS